MEIETTSAPRLKRRIPPEIRVRTFIIVPIALVILSISVFDTRQIDVTAFVVAALVVFFLVNQGMDWGYQLAFDDQRIYQRPKGWRWFFRRLPWYTIRFEDVSRVEAIHGADAGLKSRFFPFEFILIYGRKGAQGDNVVIYPPAFRDRSVKEFLHLFDSKRPGLLPDEVVEYMSSDRPL